MKIYELHLVPESNFGTPLKGDTIFGHVCWQLQRFPDLLGKPLSELLCTYDSAPFLIVSSVTPLVVEGEQRSFFFRRPPGARHVKAAKAVERKAIDERKQQKKLIYSVVNEQKNFAPYDDIVWESEETLANRVIRSLPSNIQSRIEQDAQKPKLCRPLHHPHNSISRWTGTTGTGQLAPYATEEFSYLPGLQLGLFIGLADDLPVDGLIKALAMVGMVGYGRDASTGLGRFRVKSCQPCDLARLGSKDGNGRYTLGPCLPLSEQAEPVGFMPFVRFGRHGDTLAVGENPFKNPVLMADEAALWRGKKAFDSQRPYLGLAITGTSFHQETVCQGYSLCIPVELRKENES